MFMSLGGETCEGSLPEGEVCNSVCECNRLGRLLPRNLIPSGTLIQHGLARVAETCSQFVKVKLAWTAHHRANSLRDANNIGRSEAQAAVASQRAF